MDGDPPAAMRYTEARLARAAETLLDDIDKDTVDFQSNYDESSREPVVLPARFPNLLVNGAGGIAVGMATNIPPHNLGEVIDGCCAFIDNPDITIEELMEHIPGPDFPTGGLILGRSGIRAAYHTGRGSIALRGKVEIEEIRKDRQAIVISEVPYQVNKARMLERIAEVANDKLVEGIGDLRDESDRDGVRVVIELKRDAIAEVVLAQLYRHTQLQGSFPVNTLALDGGRPVVMTLKDILVAFVAFREQVITRRCEFELNKARERAHVLIGLAVAVANLDEIIALIRRAPDPATARAEMMARDWAAHEVAPLIELIEDPGAGAEAMAVYRLTEAQARAILDLRLHRLTGLERDKIAAELNEVSNTILWLLDVLGNRARLMEILRGELVEIKERFATPRRTEIQDLEFEADIEDLIQREDMVVTVSHSGYIKRVPLSTYRAQRRGGKGRAGMTVRAEDTVSDLFVANTHTPLLLFSTRGMVYRLKVYRLPLGTPQARGKALVNLLPLVEGEAISAVLALPEDESTWAELNVLFATSAGNIRRNKLSDFANIRANGLIAMKLEEEGERLIAVRTCSEDQDALLATRLGRAIRFPVTEVRLFAGRTSTGVRGITMREAEDAVIAMAVIRHVEATSEERDAYLRLVQLRRRALAEGAATLPAPADMGLSEERFEQLRQGEDLILSVADDGMGVITSAHDYRITARGGIGITNMDLTRSDRPPARVVEASPVRREDQIMLITNGGRTIRLPLHDVRQVSRGAKGVTLFRVGPDERVVSVAHLGEVADEPDEDDGAEE